MIDWLIDWMIEPNEQMFYSNLCGVSDYMSSLVDVKCLVYDRLQLAMP